MNKTVKRRIREITKKYDDVEKKKYIKHCNKCSKETPHLMIMVNTKDELHSIFFEVYCTKCGGLVWQGDSDDSVGEAEIEALYLNYCGTCPDREIGICSPEECGHHV